MEKRFRRVISADSHVMEPPDIWWKAMGKKLGERTPRLIDEHLGQKGTYFYTGRQVLKFLDIDAEVTQKGLREAGFLPEVRVKFQEDAGVEAELLNATLMLLIMQGEHLDAVRASAQVFNDWVAEFASYNSKRLIGIGMIPMDDVSWAVQELQRITKKGLKGAIIHVVPPEGCPPYRDRAYDPFWAAAQEMGVPITLHIITGRVPDPFHFHTEKEQEEAPATMLALYYEAMGVLANEFIFGQILDRFPTLKLVCSEFEISWIPPFMFRLDQMQGAFAARLPFLPKLKLSASAYMRTRIWHGMIDDPYGRESIRHIGADQVLWGSDFPHVRSIGLETQEYLAKTFDGIPLADQEKLVSGNVAKLYGL